MSNLISKTNSGNFTASTSWGLADTTIVALAGTSETALSATPRDSVAAAPGAIEVDGILVNMSRVSGSPSGTMTVVLRNTTDSVDTKTVTVNVADLAPMTTVEAPGCWLFFKFDAPVTLEVAHNYAVRCSTSTGSQVYLYRDATSYNWNRLLRTTTEQAPAASDRLFIQREHTAAGASTANLITGNNNTTDAFGQMDISGGGTYSTKTDSNTETRFAGNIHIWNAGELDHGGSTPIASGSIAQLRFVCASAGQYGLTTHVGSIFKLQGHNRAYRWSLLNGNVSVGGTSLTVADSVDTNWESGDEVVICSTTRTVAQTELKAMSGAGSGTSVPIAALGYDHLGTAPFIPHVLNVTNNVIIDSTHASYFGYVYFYDGTIDVDWGTFSKLGINSLGKYGVELGAGATLNVHMNNFVIRDCTVTGSRGLYFQALNSAAVAVVDNVIIYNCARGFENVATTNTTWNIGNVVIAKTSNVGVSLGDVGGIFTDVFAVSSGSSQGFIITENSAQIGTFEDVTLYGGSENFNINSSIYGTVTRLKIWRCNGGIYFQSTNSSMTVKRVFDIIDYVAYGNNDSNIRIISDLYPYEVNFYSPVIDGDPTLTDSTGLSFDGGLMTRLNFYDASFGATYALSSDFTMSGSVNSNVYFYDSYFASGGTWSAQSSMALDTKFYSSRHNNTAGAYKSWDRNGTIENDTVIYRTATPSENLLKVTTGSMTTEKLESSVKQVALNNGQTATLHVWVYKGASYGGNQPRLIVKRNDGIGITSDTLLDTMAGGTGAWEELTGTTPAVTANGVIDCIVDCDGVGADKIYVDDWSTTIT